MTIVTRKRVCDPVRPFRARSPKSFHDPPPPVGTLSALTRNGRKVAGVTPSRTSTQCRESEDVHWRIPPPPRGIRVSGLLFNARRLCRVARL